MFQAGLRHVSGRFEACFRHVSGMFQACFRHVSGMFEACIRRFSFGQRQTDYIIQKTTISESTGCIVL
jgi:hypothetical protein